MAVFKAYSNGITLGVPPINNNHKRSKRSVCTGWSESATRRNTAFLYSVDAPMLTGSGYALTLTTPSLPPTSKDWSLIINKFLKRLKRMKLLRYHWVTEWQKRGVPHLHGMFYFPYSLCADDIAKLVNHWIYTVINTYSAIPLPHCQTIKPVTDAQGWAKYLGKHGSRGLKHYQRASKPDEWQKTGRMWGKGGDWPVRLSEGEIELDHFHRFRRLARNWRISDARQEPNQQSRSRRIFYARTMLKNTNRSLSIVRGISEWIPESLALLMLQATSNL